MPIEGRGRRDCDESAVLAFQGVGAGFGAQFNLQKAIDENTDITNGWSLSGELALGIWGATIEFGGNVHATATYGPL